MKTLLGLACFGLFCWLIMFLAGHDVWHFAGSPDFWHLKGPPHADLRAFAFAFYAQFFVFIGLIGVGLWRTFSAKKK